MKKITLIIIGLAMFACNKNDKNGKGQESTASTDSIIENEIVRFTEDLVKFSTIEVDASKSGEYVTENGIKLIIPNDAFVNANGEPITGKVNLKVKKFTNAAQIISAGIPMEYDSAGQTYNLMTNGMVELRGYQKEEAVNIAPGKNIDLVTNGIEDNKSFNYYKLDDKNKKWSHLNKIVAKAQRKAEKEALKVNKRYKFKLKVDLSQYKELSSYTNVVWQYEPTKGSKDPNKNLWIEKTDWENVELKQVDAQNLLYKLVFTSENKTFETTVKPIFANEDIAQAQSKFAEKESSKNFEEDSKVLTFQMSQFGVYNFDRIYHMSSAKQLNITLKNNRMVVPENAPAYMVCKGQRGVIGFKNNTTMYYSQELDFAIVVLLPGSKVGYIDKNSFLHQVENKSKAEVNIQISNSKIKTINQLEDILSSLVIR